MTNVAATLSDHPVYEEIYAFFGNIGLLKQAYLQELAATLTPLLIPGDLAASKLQNGFPLVEKQRLTFDARPMKAYFLNLLDLVESRSPQEVQRIKTQVALEGAFAEIVLRFLRNEHFTDSVILHFLLQQAINPLLQTHAAYLAAHPELKNWLHGYCPICGAQPVMGLVEAQTGTKYLICSACETRWQFSRSRCVGCGAGNVSYFIVDGDDRYRVETCAACNGYLKIIDGRRMHPEIPIAIADLTTLHLDIIARQKGYAGSVSMPVNGGTGNA
ncbi:MAG: formate dehydrogenase accessory protein FdhE [Desulfobacteraceae bacterium]|nr:MAG: formate dehydrogenase accessory protein FdhE [Desulfobacteraceae bacterium]